MTSIAFMMAAMTTALCGCTDKTVMQTDGDGNATSANDSFRIDMTRAVPGQYLSETTQQGQVVRIEYESKDYTRDDRPATRKPAYVYLPYGYDESRQYNVVYLMHGWTGTAEDTFGALGGAQKNILDWMIQQGDCQPVIVVSPTWDKDNQAKGWGESCEEIAVFHNEYENDLIPAVESRFATFAETTDRAGIVASRDHRAFGGFSLGSVTTWYVFEHCFDLQRFFLPMSGDSWHVATFGGQTAPEQTARFLATVVRSSPFGTDNGFHVWHAVGTRDARFYQTHNQAMACMQLTDVFTPHNFSYHQSEGGLHDYNSVVEFVYNALPFFFPAETGQAFTSTSRISDVMDDPAFGVGAGWFSPWTMGIGAAKPLGSCVWPGTTTSTRTRQSRYAITSSRTPTAYLSTSTQRPKNRPTRRNATQACFSSEGIMAPPSPYATPAEHSLTSGPCTTAFPMPSNFPNSDTTPLRSSTAQTMPTKTLHEPSLISTTMPTHLE